MAREHVAIRKAHYVAGTPEQPEIGVFTQTHKRQRPIPWGRISRGERVWMKWTSGPVVGVSKVEDFREMPGVTADEMREATLGYELYDLSEYWDSRPPVFAGLVIYLTDEQWLDEPRYPPPFATNRTGWAIIDSSEPARWPPEPKAGRSARSSGGTPRRGRELLTLSTRFHVLRRDGFTCRYCGRSAPKVELHVDHMIPVNAGGSNDLGNLVAACRDCNLGKGARRL